MRNPTNNEFWFLPLGGCGEIGMNMNLYGHDDQWLMVDCGVSFERNAGHNAQVIAADPSFIANQKDHLSGLVITHAHEDHIGAVAYLWPRLKCPIYTTAYTAEILRQKLSEHGLVEQVEVVVVGNKSKLDIGPFNIEWVALTHSIIEPYGLIISCPLGKVFHTADWKLDQSPMLGMNFDKHRYQQMAEDKIKAIVCDSTNALTPGHSFSEAEVYQGLLKTIKQQSHRVVVTCFGSNVARLKSLHDIALLSGRYMSLLGRSLQQRVQAAKNSHYWPEEAKLVAPHHSGYLPRNEVLAIATGSQGEERTALHRLAHGNHPDLELEEGDTVIFSSKTIPGNEQAIARLVEVLEKRKIRVIQAENSTEIIHASGHPCQDELKQMYEWVKAEIAIPVHGEQAHMKANKDIAKLSGIQRQLCGANGDLFMLVPNIGIRKNFAKVGRIVLQEQ